MRASTTPVIPFLAVALLGVASAQSSTCPGSQELGGITSTAGIGGGIGGRGTIRQYTGSPALLTSYSQELTLSTVAEMTFQVFESTGASGPWNLIDSTVVPAQGPGRAEYDSGPMSVPLINGRYYAIITYVGSGTTSYHYSTGQPAVSWVYVARIYENAYPPGTFIISGTADCHQWICTGGLVIDSVDAAATMVYRGQTGIAVDVSVTSLSMAQIDSLAATLDFTGTADRTAEYTVTPDPANPTTLPSGGTVLLTYSVDVSSSATAETITLDAAATGFDTGLGSMVQTTGAVITDTWDVQAGGVQIDQVDALDPTVVAGLGGYPVDVTLTNLGANPVSIVTVGLTFTGSADRTAEYVVTPDPSNPVVIAGMGTEILGFTVDVDLAATRELVTLDAIANVTDTITLAGAMSAGALITDQWDVIGCSAPFCGDCSGDLILNIVDALIAAQHGVGLVTLTGVDFTNCNVTGTLEPFPGAAVDILDALTLAQVAASLATPLACC